MASIFSRIIAREIPAQFVYEDDLCAVIMDKFPTIEGQTLVIPKVETDYVFDLDGDTYAHILAIAKQVAKASDKAFGTARTCLVVEGFEVPHAHIKLYPMPADNKNLGAALSGGITAQDDRLAELAAKIKSNLGSA